MTSTRLPGKVVKAVLDRPLLEYLIERLKRVDLADEVVIATTDNGSEKPIVDLCEHLSVPCFRGSEEDVLARYYTAAMTFKAELVVRVTSDCPIIDPKVIDRVIRFYLEHRREYDYVSNVLVRSYPRGMDTEVFPLTVLEAAFHESTDQLSREHVTPFIYRHPERFRLGHVTYREDQSRHRWTVDTPEDFELVRRIIEALYPHHPAYDLEDVLELLSAHPEWSLVNAHIEQKELVRTERT